MLIYWKSKESTLKKNPKTAKKLRDIFVSDMNLMMTEVLPFIEDGKQLGTLLGVTQVDPKLNNIARELSMIYRRSLKIIKSQNQIPKSIWSKLAPKYNEFLNQFTRLYSKY